MALLRSGKVDQTPRTHGVLMKMTIPLSASSALNALTGLGEVLLIAGQ
jgi:hypothetical protein